ncbi:hypothetical protein [Microbacterium sp. Se63.02b]|uniref:MarR family winged helix-turn-helix transcriptional regulator n=1 Tax=Microbacterium sp. Se63.02b TaxID=2709304 RepID=UPI001FCED338|nr:hypothetical protein [Microbacterium sp. Se63.02b]
MNTSESQNPQNTSRPFGYWLKAADRLMASEFAAAFGSEHASRRDWRILNIVDGTVASDRPLNAHKLHSLVERGWVASEGDGWTLTDEGRAAKERLGAIVDGIRAKVSAAVSDEEMATTLASLEKIARAFGWEEGTPLPAVEDAVTASADPATAADSGADSAGPSGADSATGPRRASVAASASTSATDPSRASDLMPMPNTAAATATRVPDTAVTAARTDTPVTTTEATVTARTDTADTVRTVPSASPSTRSSAVSTQASPAVATPDAFSTPSGTGPNNPVPCEPPP